MSADLNKLAERCEAATGPDRELDWRIAEAYGYWAFEKKASIWPPFMAGSNADKSIPAYTASIDAATSLFPLDTMYRSGHSATGRDPSMFFCDAVTESGADFHGLAVTEPLARVAAALRARAALSTTPDLPRDEGRAL